LQSVDGVPRQQDQEPQIGKSGVKKKCLDFVRAIPNSQFPTPLHITYHLATAAAAQAQIPANIQSHQRIKLIKRAAFPYGLRESGCGCGCWERERAAHPTDPTTTTAGRKIWQGVPRPYLGGLSPAVPGAASWCSRLQRAKEIQIPYCRHYINQDCSAPRKFKPPTVVTMLTPPTDPSCPLLPRGVETS
jgi:hypothetical protein